MKKALIIGGSLVVAGGLVYLFLRNNKKTDELLSGGTLDVPQTVSGQTTAGIANQGIGSSPINVEIPPLSTGVIITSSVVAPNNEGQINLVKAREIELKIKDYYNKSRSRQIAISSWTSSSFLGMPKGAKPTNPYPAIIEKLKNDLLKLGYEYKEGSGGAFLVKI